MYSDLEALRDSLSAISGVVSCKIGVEANISPADYPLIRLVPIRLTPGKPYNNRTTEVTIYFGANINESEGLESVYESLFTLEGEIIKTVKAQGGVYLDTFTDEDRLDTYKLMYVRCEITGERPAVS